MNCRCNTQTVIAFLFVLFLIFSGIYYWDVMYQPKNIKEGYTGQTFTVNSTFSNVFNTFDVKNMEPRNGADWYSQAKPLFENMFNKKTIPDGYIFKARERKTSQEYGLNAFIDKLTNDQQIVIYQVLPTAHMHKVTLLEPETGTPHYKITLTRKSALEQEKTNIEVSDVQNVMIFGNSEWTATKIDRDAFSQCRYGSPSNPKDAEECCQSVDCFVDEEEKDPLVIQKDTYTTFERNIFDAMSNSYEKETEERKTNTEKIICNKCKLRTPSRTIKNKIVSNIAWCMYHPMKKDLLHILQNEKEKANANDDYHEKDKYQKMFHELKLHKFASFIVEIPNEVNHREKLKMGQYVGDEVHSHLSERDQVLERRTLNDFKSKVNAYKATSDYQEAINNIKRNKYNKFDLNYVGLQEFLDEEGTNYYVAIDSGSYVNKNLEPERFLILLREKCALEYGKLYAKCSKPPTVGYAFPLTDDSISKYKADKLLSCVTNTYVNEPACTMENSQNTLCELAHPENDMVREEICEKSIYRTCPEEKDRGLYF